MRVKGTGSQRKFAIEAAPLNSSRRAFCSGALWAAASVVAAGSRSVYAQGAWGVHFSVAEFDRGRMLKLAAEAMSSAPVALQQVRAPGKRNPQEFYSEKSYPSADFAQQGSAVPFLGHVDLLVAMNRGLSALTAAWWLTGETRYFQAALLQTKTWFLNQQTRMLPTLEGAGTVVGVEDDRNNGVTGTVALAESARAAAFLCASPMMPEKEADGVRSWFAELLHWFVESKKGSIARQTKTVEAICWTMQAAEFARFTRDDVQWRVCNHLFRDGLLRLMNFDGNFPSALREENPYAASMFTLECMAAACESLSTPFESLWKANLPDGRGMQSAVAWALPYLRDRAKWPFVSDQEHFKQQPVRENALLFAGRAYDQMDYIDAWKALPVDSGVAAIERAHPITQPALWATRPPA